MCTFNGEKYVAAQIESMVRQTRLPTEIVIVDDRSTDETRSIVQESCNRQDVRILVHLNDSNLGVRRNFERAISTSNAQIIFLSDQDDVWFPQKVERILKEFEKDDHVGLVYSDALLADEGLNPLGPTVFETRGGSQIWKGGRRSPLDVITGPAIKGCTMAFRAQFRPWLLPIKKKNEHSFWGHDHWIACVLFATTKVVATQEPLMCYRIHGANTSGHIGPLRRYGGHSRFIEERYRYRYSTRNAYRMIQRYRILRDHISWMRNDCPYVADEISGRYLDVIDRELALLCRRERIWAAQSLLPRMVRIARSVSSLDYRRFEEPARSLARDLVGRKPKRHHHAG
jgi:glycosyltransferase involved in cell wall biosynthesis